MLRKSQNSGWTQREPWIGTKARDCDPFAQIWRGSERPKALMNHSRLVVKAILLAAWCSLPSGKRSEELGQPAATACFNRGHTVASHKPKVFLNTTLRKCHLVQNRCPCRALAKSKNFRVALIWVQISCLLLLVWLWGTCLYIADGLQKGNVVTTSLGSTK